MKMERFSAFMFFKCWIWQAIEQRNFQFLKKKRRWFKTLSWHKILFHQKSASHLIIKNLNIFLFISMRLSVIFSYLKLKNKYMKGHYQLIKQINIWRVMIKNTVVINATCVTSAYENTLEFLFPNFVFFTKTLTCQHISTIL